MKTRTWSWLLFFLLLIGAGCAVAFGLSDIEMDWDLDPTPEMEELDAKYYEEAEMTWQLTSVENVLGGILICYEKPEGCTEIIHARKRASSPKFLSLDSLYEQVETEDGQGLLESTGDGYVYFMDTEELKNGTCYDYRVYCTEADGSVTASNAVRVCRLGVPVDIKLSITEKKGRLRVRWKVNKQADYYEVLYSQDKDMNDAAVKKVKASKTTKSGERMQVKLPEGLESGTWYIQICTHKVVGGEDYCGVKSKPRSIEVP